MSWKTPSQKVVIVTRASALDELVAKFNTVGQTKFYLEHAGQDFAPIERRHRTYHSVLDQVSQLVPSGLKVQVIDRSFLPQFSFGETDLVVTVGPDGLVVNTAKYLRGQPILAVNPDPSRVDGILLPFSPEEAGEWAARSAAGQAPLRHVTMARASLNDGQ